jgi:phosphate transport system substrate-binding protein
MAKTLTVSVIMAVAALGCAADRSARDQGRDDTVKIGGSYTVYPIMKKWISIYDMTKGREVSYDQLNSERGIEQMTAKLLEIGCTDMPLNDEQLGQAREKGGEVIQIPVVLVGVVPAYNLKDLKQPLQFSGPVLADIFLGRIKSWNDPGLQALNPGVELPALDIVVFHRLDSTATTAIFTTYLAMVSKEWKEKVGSGNTVEWPVGESTNRLSQAVMRTPGSIGYVELGLALQIPIQHGAVMNREGRFVRASLEGVTAAGDGSLTEMPADLRLFPVNARGKESYPICGAIWAVAYRDQPSDRGGLVREFLLWVTHEGQEYLSELKYARLSDELSRKTAKKINQIKVGKE